METEPGRSRRLRSGPVPPIHLVTAGVKVGHDRLSAMVAAALDGGVGLVQLREKSLPDGRLYTLALELAGICRERGALLVVNGRADIAQAAGAAGVHLGEKGFPVTAARRVLGAEGLVGVSVHDRAGAIRAAAAGADYLYFGHVYPSGSKEGLAPRGVAELASVAAAVTIPVIAIGGVVPEKVPELAVVGAAGVAAISAFWEDSEGAARRFRAAWAIARVR